MKKFFKQNYKSILVVVIGFPIVGLIGWYRINSMHDSQHPAALAAAATPVNTSATSTTVALTRRPYDTGDCITWIQDATQFGQRNTRVVGCETPHLFEYVSKFDMQSTSAFPSKQEWDAISEANCTDPIAKYLGYKLDTNGRFAAGIIHPTSDGWFAFDRNVQCGIQLRTSADHSDNTTDKLDSFTGKVQGQDQTYLYTVGNCYVSDATRTKNVTCSTAHDYQITGNVTLSSASRPSTDSQWNSAAGNKCESTGLHFAGGKIPVGLQTGWLTIEQSSWDTGDRTVQCTIGKYDASGNVVQTTQSVGTH